MGYCSQLPKCARASCQRDACAHEPQAPHPIEDPAHPCEAYVWPEGVDASQFQGGGGGFGGGGATGGW